MECLNGGAPNRLAYGACSVVLLLAAVIGCGRSGVDRMRVYGSVTFNGEPVPAGQVRFEPNLSEGGTGPVGFASIVDGEYDTGKYEGKGPLAGPMRVRVTGYVSGKAFAPELFPRYTMEVNLDASDGELPIDVPVEVSGGKRS